MAVDRKAKATIRLCRHTIIRLSHPFSEVCEKCHSRAHESKCTYFSRSTHFIFIFHAIFPCTEEQLLKHLNVRTQCFAGFLVSHIRRSLGQAVLSQGFGLIFTQYILQISFFMTVSSEQVATNCRFSGLGEPFCSQMALSESSYPALSFSLFRMLLTWKPCKGPADNHPAMWMT